MRYADLRHHFLVRSIAMRPAWWGRLWQRRFDEGLRSSIFAAAVEGWPCGDSKVEAARNARIVLKTKYGIDPITLILIGALINLAVNVIWEWIKRHWDENHRELLGWQRAMLGGSQP